MAAGGSRYVGEARSAGDQLAAMTLTAGGRCPCDNMNVGPNHRDGALVAAEGDGECSTLHGAGDQPTGPARGADRRLECCAMA